MITYDVTKVYDSAPIKLGDTYEAGGNTYVCLKGVASTTANSWVSFDEDHVTTLLAANAKGRAAIACAATVANKFGFYCVKGKYAGKVLTGFADNGIPYATSTAGSVDDAVVTGDLILNAIGRSAIDTPSTGLAYFELNYPSVNDTLG